MAEAERGSARSGRAGRRGTGTGRGAGTAARCFEAAQGLPAAVFILSPLASQW